MSEDQFVDVGYVGSPWKQIARGEGRKNFEENRRGEITYMKEDQAALLGFLALRILPDTGVSEC